MYIVMEIQTTEAGAVGTLVTSFAGRNEAEAKYHAVLAAAAVSTLPKHAAVMLDNEGVYVKAECYTHGEASE